LQYLLNGLPIGAIYALIALGYSLIYASAGVLNWAQGDMAMLGAYVAYTLSRIVGLGFLPSMVAAMACAALVGALIERGVLRPLRRRGSPAINLIIATLGISMILRNLALVVWGPNPELFPSPVSSRTVSIGSLNLLPQNLLIVGVAIFLMLLLQYFLRFTREGKALRAVAQDRMAASLMGIVAQRSDSVAFAASAGLGAAAGILIAPLFFVTFDMGAVIGIKGFVAAVVGGLGSIPGAIAGGFVLGITEALAGGKISSGYRDAISFGVLILVLWLRPSGLFSRVNRVKV